MLYKKCFVPNDAFIEIMFKGNEILSDYLEKGIDFMCYNAN